MDVYFHYDGYDYQSEFSTLDGLLDVLKDYYDTDDLAVIDANFIIEQVLRTDEVIDIVNLDNKKA